MLAGKIKSKPHAAIGHNIETTSVTPSIIKLNNITLIRIIVSIPHKLFGMATSFNHNKKTLCKQIK